MKFIADLHIHGRFSRATSKQLDVPNLEKYAKIKGVSLLGTGDFTHPKWIEELKQHLKEDATGFLKTENGFPFVLQTEISLIYTQDGKGRRIHNVVLAPSLDVVKQITDYLLTKGRVDYDGRPIFKIPCPELVESLMAISKDIEIIPAHVWTPWFSLFGSKSGFDSIRDCYQDQLKHIHAIETGLSSDPAMNWRLSQLDNYQILSFSDLHSFWPWRIGREAAIFDIKPTYKDLLAAIRTGKNLIGTVEVDPNYGKYHFDGHRQCRICMNPKDTIKVRDICPRCRRPLTIGVLHRVEELADREEGFKPKKPKPYHILAPLSELLAARLGSATHSQAVWKEYNNILAGKTEFELLLETPKEKIQNATSAEIAELIIKNRQAKLFIQPGYDGVYGELILGGKPLNKQPVEKQVQSGLNDFMS